jgi:hypothetical protein
VTCRYELQDPKGLVPRDREHRDSIGTIEVVLNMHGTNADVAKLSSTVSPAFSQTPSLDGAGSTISSSEHANAWYDEPEVIVDETQVVCLFESDGVKLHVHEDGAALLRQLGAVPLAVVSIVGMSCSGKSWLLNQLLRRRSQAGRATLDAFGTADRWGGGQPGIWCAVVEPDEWHCEAMPEARLLLLDTPGHGGVDDGGAALLAGSDRTASEEMNEQILSLALLLSSVMVANTLGPELDDDSFDQLHLLDGFAQRMRVSSSQSTSSPSTRSQQRVLAEHMPQLLLLLRDSQLGIEAQAASALDVDGRDDEEDADFFLNEQLEAALLGARQPRRSRYSAGGHQHRTGDSAAAVRRMIRRYFPQRRCAALVSPVGQAAQLARLTELGSRDLEPEFREQLEALRESLWETAMPKQTFGRPLSASMLLELARTYADDLGRRVVPDLRKAYERAESTVLERAYFDAFAKYRDGLDEYCHRREDLQIYECVHDVYVTHDLETAASSPRSSDIVGRLVPGDVVEALESPKSDRNRKQRIRTHRGWVSLTNGSTRLMVEVAEIEVRQQITYAEVTKCLRAMDEALSSAVGGVTKSSHDRKLLAQRCQQLRRRLEDKPHATEADTLEWGVERVANLNRNLRAFMQDASSRSTTDDLVRTMSMYNPLAGGRRATALHNQMQKLLDELEILNWVRPAAVADEFEVMLHRSGKQGFGINVASDCSILPFTRTRSTNAAQQAGVREGMQVGNQPICATVQHSCMASSSWQRACA